MKDLREIKNEINNVVEHAEGMQVNNQEMFNSIATFLRGIKNIKKQINESFDTNIKNAHTTWKGLIAEKKKHTDPLDRAEKVAKDKAVFYQAEQERLRVEKERELRRKAEAEEARKRKIKEEQERAWREKERKQREEAERLEAEGRAREAEAKKAIADRAARLAEERKQEAEEVYVPPPVVASTHKKAEGISTRKTWNFRIVDANLIPRQYLSVNEKAIRSIVKALKDNTSIPGVEVYCEEQMAVRV